MRWLQAKSTTLSQSRRRIAPPPPPANQRFDDQTGQIYTETTVDATRPSDFNWSHQTDISRGKEPPQRTRPLRNLSGSRSLVDIALESILQNTHNLSVGVLQDVPPVLLSKIWAQVQARGLSSFHLWKVFSESLLQRDDSIHVYQYRHKIRNPESKLPIYTGPLLSDKFKFLAFLSITTYFPVPEIVQLHKLRNLVALEIVGDGDPDEPSVTDRSIRAWSSAAQSEGAFPVLRTLKLWLHPQVTDASLAYIDSFPSLAIYDVTDCGFDQHRSMKLQLPGWYSTKEKALLPILETICAERALTMRSKPEESANTTSNGFKPHSSGKPSVFFLPRAQVPKFLSDENIIRPESTELAWEAFAYKNICRIGELRNDGDLQKAGIDIGDQPIIDNELICPLPIAFLTLGPRSPFNASRDPGKRSVFIRIKCDNKDVDEPENSGLSSHKRSSSPTPQLTPAKRKKAVLQRKKKDLGDVLGSFMP